MAGKATDLSVSSYADGKKMAKIMSVLVLVDACLTRCSVPPARLTLMVDKISMLLVDVDDVDSVLLVLVVWRLLPMTLLQEDDETTNDGNDAAATIC